jgi:dihydrofolate reductase
VIKLLQHLKNIKEQERMKPTIEIVVAAAVHNSVIGNKGVIPWNLPTDMKNFRELTLFHPVIMGRVTYFSIPEKFRPLKDRTNIVLTKDGNLRIPNHFACCSFSEALTIAKGTTPDGKVFVAGGEQIYKIALPYAHVIHLTSVHTEPWIEGDAFFPYDQNPLEWEAEEIKPFPKDQHPENQYSFVYYRYSRPNPPKSFI